MADVTFEDSLFELQTQTDDSGRVYPQLADLLPSKDSIYPLDLNTRLAELPQFLSVQYDYNAEVVYFKCPRYYDNVDLTTMACIIQYINANGTGGIYWVPFYDTNYYDIDEEDSFIHTPTILIPWVVNGLATVASGKVTFNVRFYKLEKVGEHEYKYLYNLSTLPQTTEIKTTIDISDADKEKYESFEAAVEAVYQNIKSALDNASVYWTDV